MKILFFNWRDITHPQAGGCELHLHEIARRLVKNGHDVTLLCGAYENSKRHDKIDGIEIIRRGQKYTVYFFVFLEYIFNLRNRNFDVIIDDINGVPFFTPLYVRKPKIAIIHHMVKGIFSIELPFIFRFFGYAAEGLIPMIYRKINFITVSESSKQEMIEAGIPSQNIKIIHNGIANNYKPNWNLKSHYPHILFFGRLKRYKRPDLLIRSLKNVKERIPMVRLSIAGTGEYEKYLRKLVKKLNIDDIVTFHGYVNEEEKLQLMQSAWISVSTSHKEGWGLTVIESNACGTPAVAFNVPGLRDSIVNGETGLLINEELGIEGLSKVLIEFLENTKLRKILSKNAVQWSRRFSWDNSTIEFIRMVEEVLN